jgi:transcription-repair coupling factor (superfamily II helicase)
VADNTSLESLFLNDPNAQKLYRLIKEEGRRKIWIQGLSGSRDSFLLFSSLRQFKCTQLVIANDKEEAAYLQNDLEQFCKERELSFFPDSFKRPMSFEDLDPFQVQQRIEAVAKIRSDNSHLIISYPEALFEKILAPSRFEASRVDFIQGELLDVDEVIDKLVKYGFVRADFVFEPGQFSIRGGIIDIFSFASDHPYRIELNDIEIESIRSFDTQTQMSIQKLGRFSIIPNLNTEFENAEKKSLLEILPEQSILWIKDEQTLMDKLQTCFESAEKFGEKMIHYEEERTVNMIRDRAFVYPGEIARELKNFPLVYFDTKPTEVTDLTELRLNTKPQPSINKNFNILIEIIKDFNEKNIIPYICTSNVQQIERFYRIFEDLKADIQFQPALISIREGFIDADLKLACFTDHQIFSRFHGFKLKQGFSAEQAVSLKVLRELQPGDFVSHLDHGIGRFAGLEKINVNGQMQEAVRLIYRNHDILYVSIHSLHKISKYVGQEGTEPMLHKLGSDQWKILKQKTKAKVKEIAKELIKLYAARKASKGFAFAPDNYLQTELEASFIYEDTPDQSKATQDVKNDMEKPYPMDRLICGDVGFGKTEVAIRAAFKCIQDGKQVAILVPTTILALQHYRTISERLKEFPVDVDYVSRFRTAKEKTAILKKLKEGSLDLIIGTHSLENTTAKPAIMLYTEQTPNPESLKFVCNRILYKGIAEFRDREVAKEWSPMADALYTLDFVKAVYISNNFVTITKNPDFDWHEIMVSTKEFIKKIIESETELVKEGFAEYQQAAHDAGDTQDYSAEDQDIVKKIKEIIEHYVKPAVEMDGGNIEFKSYNAGVVTVMMQGSCSGCPSSTVTLKSGIEGLMKRMLPMVKEVVAEAH